MTDAIQTLDLLTLATDFRGDIVKQINRKTVGLRCIPMVRGEGKNIAWAPELDGAHAESYAEGADATNFGGDAQSSAVLVWALYRSNIHVSSLAQDAAAGAQSPAGNRPYWARQIVNGASKLATTLNSDLYTGNASNKLVGFGEALAKDDNTYATVDRSQAGNAYFRPTVIDPGSDTPVTVALLRDDQRKMYEACGEVADLCLTTPTLFNSIGGLYDNTRRTIQQASGPGGQVKLDFGFQALELDGMVFMRDKDATVKTLFYVNTSHCRIEVLPASEQAQIVAAMGIKPTDGFSAVPLDFSLEKLAKTGASDKAQMRWTGQLVCDRPNTGGARKHAV